MAWFSPKPLLLPDIIALNARWLQNKSAVIFEGQVTSWAQFGVGTARIGNALLGSGLAKGDRVVVLMKNSTEMLEAMFGVIRAGLVAVPLNVSVTDDAVVGMIVNSNAKAVIASDEHILRIDKVRSQVSAQIGELFIGLSANRAGWKDYATIRDAADSSDPDAQLTPADECNIIYSSGTTGLPKGIVHDHSCREAWGSDMAVALRYHAGARTLCNLGLYSNISWVAMLSTMFAGGTIIVQKKFEAFDCLKIIEAEKITHGAMVPLQIQLLLELEEFDQFDLSSMQALMCCGSQLSVGLKQQLLKKLPGAFIELYGLTEGLVTILSPEDLKEKIGSVGRPCPGQGLVILDEDDTEVAPGVAGEIVGHSRFMMSGYNNNDEENAAATWIHPSGAKWLRTGDVGRVDEDGFLYLVDRKKDMIISGGQNIYPADIEAVITTHAAIHEQAVIGVASKKWGETPLAVVVLKAGADFEPEAFTGWVNGQLGKQQRIAATVVIDELPRNPNGKILKRELRKQFAYLEF